MEDQDLRPLLVEGSAVGAETRAKLQAWEYTYTQVPQPTDTGPMFEAKTPVHIELTPRELSQVDIYRKHIGQVFVHKETGVHYRVTTVCRNETFSELFFQYVRVGGGSGVGVEGGEEAGTESGPEFSPCIEMMGQASWATWLPGYASVTGAGVGTDTVARLAEVGEHMDVGRDVLDTDHSVTGGAVGGGDGLDTDHSVNGSAVGGRDGLDTDHSVNGSAVGGREGLDTAHSVAGSAVDGRDGLDTAHSVAGSAAVAVAQAE